MQPFDKVYAEAKQSIEQFLDSKETLISKTFALVVYADVLSVHAGCCIETIKEDKQWKKVPKPLRKTLKKISEVSKHYDDCKSESDEHK